jgi:hypothetical protein
MNEQPIQEQITLELIEKCDRIKAKQLIALNDLLFVDDVSSMKKDFDDFFFTMLGYIVEANDAIQKRHYYIVNTLKNFFEDLNETTES